MFARCSTPRKTSGPPILVRIDRCSDPSCWYARMVGQVIPVEFTDSYGYWGREGGDYNAINYIPVTDATLLTTPHPMSSLLSNEDKKVLSDLLNRMAKRGSEAVSDVVQEFLDKLERYNSQAQQPAPAEAPKESPAKTPGGTPAADESPVRIRVLTPPPYGAWYSHLVGKVVDADFHDASGYWVRDGAAARVIPYDRAVVVKAEAPREPPTQTETPPATPAGSPLTPMRIRIIHSHLGCWYCGLAGQTFNVADFDGHDYWVDNGNGRHPIKLDHAVVISATKPAEEPAPGQPVNASKPLRGYRVDSVVLDDGPTKTPTAKELANLLGHADANIADLLEHFVHGNFPQKRDTIVANAQECRGRLNTAIIACRTAVGN